MWNHVLYCFTKFTQWSFVLFVPPPEVDGAAFIVGCIPIEQIGCMPTHLLWVIDVGDVELEVVVQL